MKHRHLRMACLGLACTLLVTGCGDATAPDGDPPEIPPATSLIMDFSDFTDAPLTAPGVVQPAPAAGTYWTRSAFVVGIWNLILAGTLAPPTAAFIASFPNEPVWVDSLSAWTWSYNFNVLGVQHSARLEGRLVTNAVQWDMYISRDGGFTDFNWFSGLSDASGQSGTWSLNHDPNNPTPFLDIEWSRSASGDTYDLRYTNVITGNAEYGSYIEHGVTGDTPYDAYYDLYGAQGDNLAEIEWNRTTKEGRTKDPAFFEDSEWHCWDANLDNTTCQ